MYLVKDLKVWQGHGEVQLIPLVPIAVVALLQYLDLGKVTLAYQVDDGNERKQTLVTYFSLLAGCGINGQITKGGANPGDCTKSGGEGLAAYWPYSQCLDDSFSVTNPGGISPPTICGKNQGRHSKLMKIKKFQKLF